MKFSHTLIGIAAAFASASSESNSNMNMFSTLAESAVDASSWNFDNGKHVCRVYGDPHVLAYNGATINFAGTGEFLMASFETTSGQPIYVTASTFTEPGTEGNFSYVDSVGFFCGESKLITRAPFVVGRTPAVYNLYGQEINLDTLGDDFSSTKLGDASNALKEDGDDIILQSVCSPQGLNAEVELYVKYHTNEFNTPVINFAIHFAETEDIVGTYGMCQSPCQPEGDFYGGFGLDNGYCHSDEPVTIQWGQDFQKDLCGPCSWSVVKDFGGRVLGPDLGIDGTISAIVERHSPGINVSLPQVPFDGDVCYNPPLVGWPP